MIISINIFNKHSELKMPHYPYVNILFAKITVISTLNCFERVLIIETQLFGSINGTIRNVSKFHWLPCEVGNFSSLKALSWSLDSK